jgi:isopenicillin N synthase-like dioxygenase
MTQREVSPVADLQTVDFSSIYDGNPGEIARLLQICSNDGFFYLDLSSFEEGKLLQNLDRCNAIVREWFEKPLEEKSKTVTLSDAHGYKRVGQQSGVNEGQRDGYESLRVCLPHGPLNIRHQVN